MASLACRQTVSGPSTAKVSARKAQLARLGDILGIIDHQMRATREWQAALRARGLVRGLPSGATSMR